MGIKGINKNKSLNSVIELQRELAAREATLTGRACVGVLTDERDIGSDRVLVKHISVGSYSINKRLVEGRQSLSIVQHMSYLDHAWLDYDLIIKEDDGEVMFEGDVDKYQRYDGTTSQGFVPLHKLGSLCLNMAQGLYYSDKHSLEDAFNMASSFIEHVADAIDEKKNMCLLYINPYLLTILINKYHNLKVKLDHKKGIPKVLLDEFRIMTCYFLYLDV